MIPTTKNSGSTVLGVRMGCHAFKRCCRKAVSMLSWSMSVRSSVESAGWTYWAVSCSFPSCHPVLLGAPASVSNPDPFVCMRAMMREAATIIHFSLSNPRSKGRVASQGCIRAHHLLVRVGFCLSREFRLRPLLIFGFLFDFTTSSHTLHMQTSVSLLYHCQLCNEMSCIASDAI